MPRRFEVPELLPTPRQVSELYARVPYDSVLFAVWWLGGARLLRIAMAAHWLARALNHFQETAIADSSLKDDDPNPNPTTGERISQEK